MSVKTRIAAITVAAAAAVVLPAAPSYAAEHDVSGECSFHLQTLPNSSNVTLVVTGVATAGAHPVPVETGIECVAIHGGVSYPFAQAMPGAVAVVAGSATFELVGLVRICATAYAWWSDGHFESNGPLCS